MNEERKAGLEGLKERLNQYNHLPQGIFEMVLTMFGQKYVELISNSYNKDAKELEEFYLLVREKGIKRGFDLSKYPDTLEELTK